MKWTAFAFVLLLIHWYFPSRPNHHPGPILAVYCVRQSTDFFKIFSNFTHFCPNFQIFCPPLLILTCLCHCCPFFWKIACMPLLSKIGPDHHGINLFYLSLIFFPRLEEYTDLLTRKSLPHRNFPWLNQNWGRCLFYSNIITIK